MSALELDEDLAIAAQEMRRSAAVFRDNPPSDETPEYMEALIAGNEHIASVMERARADLATLKAENERLAPVIAAAKAQRIAADALLEAIATGARKQPHGMLAATRAATEQAVRETDPAPSAESEAT